MGKYKIEATSNGIGFSCPQAVHYSTGLDSQSIAEEQVKQMYGEEGAIVFFTCTNVALSRIMNKAPLYCTFSADELDILVNECMDVYEKIKRENPYDGSTPFESYIVNFVLPTARQKYARGKACDNDHIVQQTKNCRGENELYGTHGKMVSFVSLEDYEYLASRTEDFEDQLINELDAQMFNTDQRILRKIERAHPLLKIIIKYWIEDSKEKPVALRLYARDERVLALAEQDEKCIKYVLERDNGIKELNESTIARMLYEFRDRFKREEIDEIKRLGIDFRMNPYLKALAG